MVLGLLEELLLHPWVHLAVPQPWRITHENIDVVRLHRQPDRTNQIPNVVGPDPVSANEVKFVHQRRCVCKSRLLILAEVEMLCAENLPEVLPEFSDVLCVVAGLVLLLRSEDADLSGDSSHDFVEPLGVAHHGDGDLDVIVAEYTATIKKVGSGRRNRHHIRVGEQVR